MKISMFRVIKKCVQKSIYIQWSIKNTNRDRLRFWDKQIKKTRSIEFEKIFLLSKQRSALSSQATPPPFLSLSLLGILQPFILNS